MAPLPRSGAAHVERVFELDRAVVAADASPSFESARSCIERAGVAAVLVRATAGVLSLFEPRVAAAREQAQSAPSAAGPAGTSGGVHVCHSPQRVGRCNAFAVCPVRVATGVRPGSRTRPGRCLGTRRSCGLAHAGFAGLRPAVGLGRLQQLVERARPPVRDGAQRPRSCALGGDGPCAGL